MLGRTAAGLYWMFRYLERGENSTRLLDAGHRISLTHSSAAPNEWASIINAQGSGEIFEQMHRGFSANNVINFILRDKANPSSIASTISRARENGKMIRTALTREVWEAANESWLTSSNFLSRQVGLKGLPRVLNHLRVQSNAVSAALHGTMLRDDIYNFALIGTFIERGESIARLLDVKYYVLLPTASHVGSSLDNVQWETILRSAAALKSFSWLYGGDANPAEIANFLIFDRRMPRSITFSFTELLSNLNSLAQQYGFKCSCHDMAQEINAKLVNANINSVMNGGLHEFILGYLEASNSLSRQIEKDYRFYD